MCNAIHTYLHNRHIVLAVPLARAGVDAQDLGAGDAAVEEPVKFVWEHETVYMGRLLDDGERSHG